MFKLYAIERPDGTWIGASTDYSETMAWDRGAAACADLCQYRTCLMDVQWPKEAIRRGYRCVEVEIVKKEAGK